MEYDCGFTNDNKWFRYRAAAIIVEDGCVLFAGNEKDDYYNRKIKIDTFKELWKTNGRNHNVAIRVVRKQ